MIKLKKLLGILLFLSIFISSNAYSTETRYGIGSTVSNFSGLYLPISTTNYLFEPIIAISSDKFNNGSNNVRRTSNRDRLDFLLGIYKKSKLTTRSVLYAGAKFGIADGKREDNFNNTKTIENTRGLSFAPTIGIEYRATTTISIAIEVALNYQNEQVKQTTDTTSDSYTNTTIRSSSRFIARFYF